MKVLILGAGTVGRTAAYHLAREPANEVTIVDLNEELLRELQDRLDVRAVAGNACFPSVLENAGIADTDILVALTNSDEVNIVACEVANHLYRTPTKIARIRSAEYTSRAELFADGAMAVDVWISPEQLVTEYIERLIHYPGALQVVDFADGKVRLVGLRARRGGLLVGQQLRTLKDHMPHAEARVAAIYRKDRAVEPTGDTVIEENDEIFFLAARDHIRRMMAEIRRAEDPVRKVVIAGGGNIGFRLAQRLEKQNQVKLIERDPRKARRASEVLENTIVLNGDAQDEELLIEENIDATDVFVSLTNSEEANLLSAMLAKRLGAHKVMALVNKPSYGALMEQRMIDVAISPQTVTIGSLLAHVRRGDVVRVHSLRRGTAEGARDRGARAAGPFARDRPHGRRDRAARRRADQRHRARRTRADRAPRHAHRTRGPRHRVPLRPPARRSGRAAVPGRLTPPAHARIPSLFRPAALLRGGAPPARRAADAVRGAVRAAGGHRDHLSRRHLRRLHHLRRCLVRRGRAALLRHQGAAQRAEAARRLPAGVGGLAAAHGRGGTAADAGDAGHLVHRRLLRGDVRPLHDRLHRALGSRSPAARDQPLAPCAALFGGMGIIVLAVAILPLLGVGGMQLYRAETPGPVKDAKLTPRITQTAKMLWMVYCGITAACFASLVAVGMPVFDAICHAFSVMSLGGFSTHDASIMYFDSPGIEFVMMVFMVLAAMNFATHFVAVRKGDFSVYRRDPEARWMLVWIAVSVVGMTIYLRVMGTYTEGLTALRHASFSLITLRPPRPASSRWTTACGRSPRPCSCCS